MDYNLLERKIMKIVKKASELTNLKNVEISEKENPSNIVTSADLAVQTYLCKELSCLIKDSGFFCEEENVRDNKEYMWIIDPIDGTTNFSRNIPDYVISVALAHKNEVIIGVVYCPNKKQMFHACKGKGAYLNDKKLNVSNKKFSEGILCSAMSLYRKEYAKICNDIIYETYMECNDIRRFGSCALELCYLAAGKVDLYFEIRVFPWDYAASSLIVKEAGGILKGFNKEELHFDKITPLIGANNEYNYEKLNGIVNKYMKEITYERSCNNE